ncbi:VOC family protein [Mucilaginibacter sp. UR6-11]|uniref:VOC family protein n=1 Tax=Mucilaginibacter sp. UR6-11 TaxID=1435644 RepID=UPI001E2FEB5C|nr:VOC family protein [Mucilaginibacter sp. UR6-11]MCC8427192.1 VOC family protein [Mucilaginibacter sp. UR6-11]
MVNFKRTDHINICVAPAELEAARKFYADVLGLQQISRPDHIFITPGYWFIISDIQLHIGVEPPVGRTFRHTAFEVTSLAAARRHLEANSIRIDEEPVIEGRNRFTFLDPFGNRMELLEYLA